MVSLSPTPLISCAATLWCGTNFSRSLVTFFLFYIFFALLDLLLFQQPSGCLSTSCLVRMSTVRAVLSCETSYLVAVLIDLSGCSPYRFVKSSWKLWGAVKLYLFWFPRVQLQSDCWNRDIIEGCCLFLEVIDVFFFWLLWTGYLDLYLIWLVEVCQFGSGVLIVHFSRAFNLIVQQGSGS